MDGGLVTIAFVDVEGSTELLTRLGDVAGTAAIESLLETARERIEPYGGRQVKSLGDGLMLVFPTPRQAVGFAIAVQSALVGRRPRLRIGVHTGEVVRPADDPVGEAVNAAARISAKAIGGEVLVSDVVRQLVGSMPAVRFADRGRTRLKGFADQWRLFAVSGSDGPTSMKPVFGREPELAAVDWVLAGLAEGSGRALVLEGEAGIGKTHVIDALCARASTLRALVLRGSGDEIEQDRPGRILLAVAEGLEVPLAALLANLDVDEGSRGFTVVEAVVDAVQKAATGRPVVAVAEDLHWADELSLRGIAALARRLDPLPIALALTLRPAPRPALLDRVFTVLDGVSHQHITLCPLDAAAVGSLVALSTGAAPGETLSERLAGASGNPLFVVELLRALDHDGALRVDGGVVETDDQPLPSTLRDTVLRRLSSMAPSTVEALRLASLLGAEFVLTDLATVSGQSVVSVAALLHEAVAAGVLSGEADTLSFRHDLIREAIYDDIAPAIRRDLHAAAGRALAACGAPTAQVARQLALGARPGDLAAVEWLERAAREALALDPGIAVDLFRRALAVAPDPWPGRSRIETSLLEPLAWSGRIDEARTLAGEVLRRTRDPREQVAARRGLVAVHATTGDLRAAIRECEAAAAAPAAPADDAALLRCVAAGMALLVGRPTTEVLAAADRALAEARMTGSHALACWAHQTQCLAALAEGRHDDGLDHAQQARDILDAHWVPAMGFLIPHLWVGSAHVYLDQFDEFLVAYEEGRQRAQRRGESGFLLLAHAGTASVHFLTASWDDALSEIGAGLVLAHETGGQAMTLLSHALAARIALGRGDLAATEEHLSTGRQLLATGGHLFGVELLQWTQSCLFEAQREPAAALELLSTLWDQTQPIRYLLQYRNFAPDLVRLAYAEGDVDRARAVATELELAAGRSTSVSAQAVAARARGIAENDPALLVSAVTQYRHTPRRFELAGACEDAATALFAHGHSTDAAGLLDEAAGVYAGARANQDIARVDAALRTHGIRRRRHAPATATHGWESLTPKEREVVQLVVDGRSNPEIGTRLYISRRTVETHLSHIFRKLGLANRAHLAAEATRRLVDSGTAARGGDI